ncbi:universal stress protein [Aerococcus vaginalis]
MLDTIHKILVPIDDSKQAANACEQAAHLAKACDASLIFLNVIRENESLAHILTTDERDALIKAREQLLKDFQKRALEIYPDIETEDKILFGDARQGILNLLNEGDYQMVVMGATGKGAFKRVVVGSVAQFVARHSPVPVLLVRHSPEATKKILIPSDASEPSKRALRLGISLGKAWESNLDLLTVTENFGFYSKAYNFQDFHDQLHQDAEDFLRPIAAKYDDNRDITMTTHVIDGDPRLEILKFAQTNKVDMIVIGASGKGSVKRLILGSVSEYVLMHAETNVLIIH